MRPTFLTPAMDTIPKASTKVEEEDRTNRQNTVDIDGSFFTYFSRPKALASSNGTTINIFTGDRAKNTADIVVDDTSHWHKGRFCAITLALARKRTLMAGCVVASLMLGSMFDLSLEPTNTVKYDLASFKGLQRGITHKAVSEESREEPQQICKGSSGIGQELPRNLT
ncbi:hypothetical protein Trydic_g18903 [Trypoxylus dichotomus]